jgi:hypothetical protein
VHEIHHPFIFYPVYEMTEIVGSGSICIVSLFFTENVASSLQMGEQGRHIYMEPNVFVVCSWVWRNKMFVTLTPTISLLKGCR